ncbi:MAG: methyltransferase domain-containing protein, partial [Candidatus Woesearchaeota archaeon]|nr:methyltransferase domain-containing protein [Candidatus Woesearchaeota archaeon]
IANTILQQHKNVKTVFKKYGVHKGKHRTQNLKFLAGINTKETIYKENNVFIKLDVEKCYFSPRLSSERLRISKLVKPNESILVMFSGVMPYGLTISKNTKAKEIYGIELNKTAHKYAKENTQLNKLFNIELYQGDIKKVLPKINKKFDRIIMPLPKGSQIYLNLALKKLKPKGTIHLYLFSKDSDFNKIIKQYSKKFKKVNLIKCGQYSPHVYRICLDLKI